MDLGTIQYNVEANTTDLEKANQSVDQFAENATQAGDSVDAMSKKVVASNAAVAASSKKTEGAFRGLRGQAQNLGWQLQDIVVQAQMGTSAFTIFSQQGSQLVSTMGKGGPLIGALIAVGGVIGGVLFQSLMTTGKAMEDMADRAKELTKDMDSLTDAQKAVVQAAMGYTIKDQEEEIKKLTKTIDDQIKSIEKLEKENGKASLAFTSFGGVVETTIYNNKRLENSNRELIANQNLLIEQQNILNDLQGGIERKKNAATISGLKEELDLIGLKGSALYELEAAQKKLTGLDAYAYVQTKLNIEAAESRIDAEKDAEKEREKISEKAIADEEKRAGSIQKMIDQLAKEAALMGNSSKEADIRYGISSGLIKAYGEEAKALIANAQAVDAQTEAMKRAKVEAGLMDDFESALGKENAQIAELDAFSQSVDNFGGAWSRTGSIVVDALGSIADAMGDYQLQMEGLAEKEKEYAQLKIKYKDDPAALSKLAKDRIRLDQQVASANISGYRSMAGAASQMFDEQSKERKALHNAEQVFTAIEIALAMQKASANALTAITSSFAAPFPVNFAAGAAMIAIMAGLGVFSGGGGGSAPTAEDIQESQGTGSIMGDADAKAESIVNALEEYQDIGIDQLYELRGIRDAMNSLAGGIAQLAISFVAGGKFKESGISGLGTKQNVSFDGLPFGNEIYDFLNPGGADLLNKGLGDLFGKTSKKLKDTGLKFGSQSLGDILAGQLEADYYNTIETTKKKLFGLSKKTSTKDEIVGVDSEAADEISRIFSYMGDVVQGSIDVLGIDTERALSDFAVSIGKVSFKDLTGEEIQSELEAIFSNQADLLAEFMLPQITMYQQMGEGAFETLTRVAQEQAVFNDAMDNMGLSMTGVSGIMAVDMAQSIADLMGGFENFTDKAAQYVDKFFSEEEKFAMLQGSLADVFGSLNTEMPDSIMGFRSIVEGIDRTTESGQRLFASLLEISPAFSEYADQVKEQKENELKAQEQLTAQLLKAEQDKANAILKAQEEFRKNEEKIAASRYGMQIDLLKAQGNEEAAIAMERARILENLDESLRPLQNEIWATTDAVKAQEEAQRSLAEAQEAATKAAEQAAQQLADNARSAFDALSASIGAERSRIEGIVSAAGTAKSALDSALSAEKSEIEKQYSSKIEGLKSLAEQERGIAKQNADAQNEMQKSISKARIDSLKYEQSEIQDRVGSMRSLFESLSGVSDDIALQSLDLTRSRRAMASADIDAAIRRMQSGGGLPIAGELEKALGYIKDNPSELYKSAEEMAFETAKLQNKINTLAGAAEAQLTTDEKLLAALEQQIKSSEFVASTYVEVAAITESKYDTMIAQAEAELAAELASRDLIAQTAQDQLDKLTGLDSRQLNVEKTLTAFNDSLLAADFENAQQQYEQLDSLLSTGQSQLNAMLSIDDRILSLNEGVSKFIEPINAAQSDNANKEMLAQMQRMADEITQLREEQRSQSFAQQKALNTTAKNTTELVYSEPVA